MLGPITPLLIEESHDYTPEPVRRVAGHPLHRVWMPLEVDHVDGVIQADAGEGILGLDSVGVVEHGIVGGVSVKGSGKITVDEESRPKRARRGMSRAVKVKT